MGYIRKLAHVIGRRGAFLLFLAELDFVYAYSLAFPTFTAANSPTFVFLSAIMPTEVWAVLWAVVGAFCFYHAFKQQDALGYAAAMFLKVLWALMFLLGWLFADVERAYLSTVFWGTFAAVVGLISTWSEPLPEREKWTYR